jgi:addiction module RelE/StbE family toxin
MRIIFSDRALRDLTTLRAYLEKDSRVVAQEQVQQVLATISLLSEHPRLGRTGRVGDTYELVIPHTRYIAVYVVDVDATRIIAVIHSSTMWPKRIE